MNKTIALPLGNLPRTCNIPFTWSGSGFKYLGIHILPNIRGILKQNIDIVRNSIKKDLSRWMDLPVSWMGRINLIKMNVLPRLLYPLQMLPITLTKKTVKEIEKDMSRFIWRGRKPRLSMKTLQLPKDKGGLAFPNILLYNWSCHSRVIHEWIHTYLKDTDDPLEAWTCQPFNLLSELVSKYNKKHNKVMIDTYLKTWRDMSKYTESNPILSYITPFLNNQHFTPGMESAVFQRWFGAGIRVVGDLFDGNVCMSFEQVQKKYTIHQTDFFAFLQARHLITSCHDALHNTMQLGPMENFFLHLSADNSTIRQFYNVLQGYNKHNIGKLIRSWEGDLQCQCDDHAWSESIQSVHSLFLSNRFKEIQYKILHRQHRTPIFLNKIDPSRSAQCIKCKSAPGSYVHCLWTCSKISKFWLCVTKELKGIFKSRIQRDPAQYLLGLPISNKFPDKNKHILLCKLLFLARKCILFNWINEKPPTITQWYKEIFRVLPMERLSAKLSGNDDIFWDIWRPLLDYLPDDLKKTILIGTTPLHWRVEFVRRYM
ncbi:unnamed protein product [Oreochromis niloticus]|nr:unnamed protein product [Mustela putorius furo]